MQKTLCRLVALAMVLILGLPLIPIANEHAQAATTHIVQIAAGDRHSLALFSDGSLYAWGQNFEGQLGDGTRVNRKLPVKVGTGYTAIAAGGYHTLALKGTDLYAWGLNDDGQLGNGTKKESRKPIKIGSGFTAIAAGANHSMAFKGEELYTWGYNGAGQLGDGTYTVRTKPVCIGSGFTTITAGEHFSAALKGTQLYVWGRGDLADGSALDSNIPVSVGVGFTAIAAGSYHILALKGTSMYAWGANDSGQLGNGTMKDSNSPVNIGVGYTAIAPGVYHNLALKGTNLYSWGDNIDGQLGDGTNTTRTTPVGIGEGYSAIAAGAYHSLLLKGTELYACGANPGGQLGDGTNKDKTIPVRVIFPAAATSTPENRPTKIRITASSTQLNLGEIYQLSYSLTPTGAETTVTWKSSKPKVVMVSPDGELTPLKEGTAQITVTTSNKKKASIKITVVDPKKPIRIIIDEERPVLVLNVNTQHQLKYLLKPDTAESVVTWKSSKPKIAAVDPLTGVITALKPGKTIITATTANKKKATIRVNVVIP